MLSVELTADLLDDANVLRADSCATANHPMIDHLWRERLPLADRLIGVRGPAAFAAARRLEAARRAAFTGAKRLRGLLPGR
jgi:hypothetical protein